MEGNLLTRLALAMMLAAVIALSAAAQPERVAERGGVAYVSGGIGEDSLERLKAREAEFNLKLVFSLVQGNYVAEVGVTVKDAQGKALVEHVADGPIFMAKLPAGAYAVEVSYEGRSQARGVKVGERLRTEHFRWPADPAADLPVSRWLEPGKGPQAGAVKKPQGVAKPAIEAPRGGPIAMLSGGIGETALAELQAKEGDYNLKLVFTLTQGNYLADINVVVKDAAGRTVVEHFAEGPIFLARLPQGTYSANVSHNGRAQSRKIQVGERLRTEYFRWPADPAADLPVSRWLEPEAGVRPAAKR